MELVNFEALEGKIKNIVDEYALLKKKNQDMEILLNNKIGELEEANKKLRGLEEEKDFIRTRVDSLLGLLKDIDIPK